MVVVGLVAVSESEGAASIFDRPHAFLIQGRSGQFKWRVVTHRTEERGSAHRPCLDLSIDQRPSPLSTALFFSLCGTVSPFPLAVAMATDEKMKGKTLVAVAIPREARLVLMDLGSAGKRSLYTKLLSKAKAHAAQLDQFRFASTVVSGAHCIQQLKTFDASGRLLTDSGRHSCV